jgi:hypothetical protein
MFFRVAGGAGGARPLAPSDARENDMTVTTGRKASQAPRAERPRLLLQPDESILTLLDGGWWPRSADPAAELPGLIRVLDERLGRVTRVMLGLADWNAPRPHVLPVNSPSGRRAVPLGWFATMPAGLLTAFSANGLRTDLVTISPDTCEQDAVAAMERAAEPANRDHAPAILAVIREAALDRSRAVPRARPSHLRAVGERSS